MDQPTYPFEETSFLDGPFKANFISLKKKLPKSPHHLGFKVITMYFKENYYFNLLEHTLDFWYQNISTYTSKYFGLGCR